VACGLPLTHYRSRFGKIVSQTGSWMINIIPVFVDEIKVLSGNVYPENQDYLKMRNFYGFYLSVYTLLFVVYRFVG